MKRGVFRLIGVFSYEIFTKVFKQNFNSIYVYVRSSLSPLLDYLRADSCVTITFCPIQQPSAGAVSHLTLSKSIPTLSLFSPITSTPPHCPLLYTFLLSLSPHLSADTTLNNTWLDGSKQRTCGFRVSFSFAK